MIVQRATLDNILLSNVCELRFVRRVPLAGNSPSRHMLCTKSYSLLNSSNGRITLNYRSPRGPVKINEAADNLIVVWDILMQDYIDKRTQKMIGEDIQLSSLESMKDSTILADVKELLSYFVFDGTGKGDSSCKANSILYYETC